MISRIKNLFFKNQIEEALNCTAIRLLEQGYPATDEQKRWLAFGAVLFTQNLESCKTFKVLSDAECIKEMLLTMWGIDSREEALLIAEGLSMAKQHTPFGNFVFKSLPENGQMGPITRKDLELTEEDLRAPDDPPLTSAEFEGTINSLIERINTGLISFTAASSLLVELGFWEDELFDIDSIAAWDYGRTSMIARFSAKAGYLEEHETWSFMKTAADNAVNDYYNWRQYIIGYILGRAIAYGNDSQDIKSTLYYLLTNPNSPFENVSFK